MALNKGDKAPFFEGKDQNGKNLKLSDFKGKKLVLYFYPKDDTETCTKQACNLRDNFADFKKAGYQIIGVSTDDEKSHQKFIAKYQLPFSLIADTEQKIASLYEVWQEKTLFGHTYMGIVRTTFLIDEKGIITEIIKKIKSAEHSKQILK